MDRWDIVPTYISFYLIFAQDMLIDIRESRGERKNIYVRKNVESQSHIWSNTPTEPHWPGLHSVFKPQVKGYQN